MCPRQRRREALRGSLHGAALVPAPAGKSVAVPRREVAAATHPVCLGLEGGPSYSDSAFNEARAAPQMNTRAAVERNVMEGFTVILMVIRADWPYGTQKIYLRHDATHR